MYNLNTIQGPCPYFHLDLELCSGDRIIMKKQTVKKKSNRFIAPLILTAATVLLFILHRCDFIIPPMDDTYIHLVYGRSILSSAFLCFNGIEPSSGFTSPLWLLPSALASMFGTTLAPLALMGFSLLAAGAALFLLPSLTGILLMLAGPFFFHASSGMETALSSLAVIAVWKCVRDGCGNTVTSLILAGAFLTRPELAILVIPVIYSIEDRTPGTIVRVIMPSLIAGLLWILWNIHSTGLPLPSTFYAKQPTSWFNSAVSGLPGLLKGLLITSPVLLFAFAASIKGFFNNGRDGQRAISLILIPLLLIAVSLFTQPNSFFQMRYYVPSLTAMVLATGYWLDRLKRRRLNAVILAVSMLPGLIIFAGRRADASCEVFSIDVRPARYLSGMTTPEQTVAAADIGAIKWITGINILDLDGLVTPERLPGPDRREWKWIHLRSDYLLAFPDQYSALIVEAGSSLEFITGFGSNVNVICGEDSVALWKIR